MTNLKGPPDTTVVACAVVPAGGLSPGLDKTLREALGAYDTFPQRVLNDA